MRCVLAAIIAAFCFSVSAQQPPEMRMSPPLGASDEARLLSAVRSAHARNAVVHVGDRGACSGFFVDRQTVITAGHCYRPDEEVKINGEPATLKKKGYAESPKDGVDLALYTVENGARVSRVNFRLDPSPIEQVFLIATIGSRVGLIQYGRLSFVTEKFYDVDMQGGPGSSGGGIYSYDGRLVCVMVSGFYMGNAEESFLIASTCVPAKRVREFIENQ